MDNRVSDLIDNQIEFWICVPVYKVEKYLDSCVKSVLNQTYKGWKMVLVDDGSPDNCGTICDKYAETYSNIISIHQANMGQLAARQTALDYVRRNTYKKDSERIYIVYVDSDDSLKENALERICKTIQQSNADMVVYGYDRVFEGKTVSEYDRSKGISGELKCRRELLNLFLKDTSYNPVWRKSARLSLHDPVDYSIYYGVRYAEDLLQSLVLYKNTKKTVFINEALYNYTYNPESITQTESMVDYYTDTRVRGKALAFIKNEKCINDEDLKKYYLFCGTMLKSYVYAVSILKTKYCKKKELLSKFLENTYYNEIIDHLIEEDLLIRMLHKRKFFLIVSICKMVRFGKELKRKFKNH